MKKYMIIVLSLCLMLTLSLCFAACDGEALAQTELLLLLQLFFCAAFSKRIASPRNSSDCCSSGADLIAL